jgi:hypothetical protein
VHRRFTRIASIPSTFPKTQLQNAKVNAAKGVTRVTNMSNKGAIFAGALGGVAPNLVRLIVNLSSSSPSFQHITNQPVLYFLAMVGFAILGALVVWAFQETNLKQALFLGISLPSLFQTGSLQLAPSSNPPTMAPGTQASISLVSSAYAQPPPGPSAPVPNRTLNLTADKNVPYTVAFYGMDNRLISSSPVTNPASVAVPPEAVKFALQVGASTSNSYELPKTSAAVIKADVNINEKPTSGFIQGLGLAKTPQYEITVRVQ